MSRGCRRRPRNFPRRGELRLTDASHNYAAVAVQGPRVKEFIDACIPGASVSAMRVGRVTDLKKNQIGGFKFGNASVLVSRTGYTGEDGFEIVGCDEAIQHVWDKILAVGQPFGIKPAGLGARDTLRTEVCYPLYGHELDENTTPIEAGVGFFVALDKGEFNGRSVLAEQKANGVKKKLVAFKMTGQIRAAASALSDLGERRESRRSRQRHAKSVARASASAWVTCRRNSRSRTRRLKSRFAANVSPPSS